MLFIADKYKEKGLTLDELFHHYDKLIVKKTLILKDNLIF